MYVIHCWVAMTMRRAIWNFCSSVSAPGSSETIRLCSRANSVWTPVSATFSLARVSPATTTRSGSALVASISGADSASPRASRRGSNPPGSSSRAPLLLRSPSTGPSRSHSSRSALPP